MLLNRGRNALGTSSGGGGAGGSYTAQAVNFASGTFLNTDSLVANPAGSPYLSAAGWFKQSDEDIGYPTIFQNAGSVSAYSATLGPSAYFFVDMVDATDANTYAVRGNGPYRDGIWHSFVLSGQSNLPAGEKVLKLYIDDIDVTNPSTDINSSFVMTNNGVQFTVGDDTFGDWFIGDMADLRIMETSLLVAGDIPEVTRRLFVDAAGKPVDPAVATAALGAPMILFSGNAASFATNKGTGGSFDLTGDLTNATTSPSD